MTSKHQMAYSQTKATTEIERKMQSLKLQLHGKNLHFLPNSVTQASHHQPETNQSIQQDLIKTIFTAGSIILAQLALYLSINRGLIRI